MSLLIGASSALQGAAGAAGGAADLGDTINQSLRFRGGQQLTRTIATDSAGTISTFSFWVKLGANDGSDQVIFSYGGSSYFRYNTSQSWTAYGGGAADCNWTGKARDYSAWYHIVMQGDGNGNSTNNKVWLNGDEISTEFSSRDFPGITQSGGTFRIGDDTNGNNHFTGYLADFICVNGSAVDPLNNFGKYNGDGVWVPVNYTGSYGSKGFRLIFDSSAGIGDDSSGNGNDFTATGFETADVAVYTGNEAGSGATYQSDASNRTSTLINAGSAFDGVTAGGTQVSESAGGYWYLTKTVNNVSGLRILMTGQTSQIADTRINGSTVTTSVSGNYIVVSSPPSTVNEVAIRRNTANTQVFQVEVDTGSGFTALLDNTDNDIDYKDTPTNNYTTLNPLQNRILFSSGLTYEHANLRAMYGGGGSNPGHFTQGFRGGKFYWEVTPKVQVELDIGLVSEDYDPTNDNQQFGETANGWAWRNSATSHHNGTTVDPSHTAFGVDDTVGILVDTDAGTAKIEVNGAAQSSSQFSNIPTNKLLFPALRLGGGSGDANAEFNFGQMPFVHTQTGYNDLSTDNYPEPTIKNSKEYFDVITYDGTGSAKSETGLEFQPDFVWIKKRSNEVESHVLTDSVRGTSKSLLSDSNVVEVDSSARLTQFNSDGFSVGDDVSVNQSGRTYVAWCWKCDESFTPTVTGVSSASGKRNTTAGFSILTYTGNNTSGTITHGLNSAPEFILFKRRSVADNWVVYHASAGATQALSLDGSGQAFSSTFLSNTAPTGSTGSPASTITLGGVSGANGTGTFVAYCWHSVEGFSKFGEYTANGSADGPFVYTGFTPAFIILKTKSGANGSWQLYDTTRDTTNPNTATLVADGNPVEVTSGNDLDILSNGFKPRDNGSINNGSGNVYLYMAFASSPFGGENAPPATAR